MVKSRGIAIRKIANICRRIALSKRIAIGLGIAVTRRIATKNLTPVGRAGSRS